MSMSVNKWGDSINIILTADDFGLSEATNRGGRRGLSKEPLFANKFVG